jgi:hypothetical protein
MRPNQEFISKLGLSNQSVYSNADYICIKFYNTSTLTAYQTTFSVQFAQYNFNISNCWIYTNTSQPIIDNSPTDVTLQSNPGTSGSDIVIGVTDVGSNLSTSTYYWLVMQVSNNMELYSGSDATNVTYLNRAGGYYAQKNNSKLSIDY